jgi:hypothetical protein
MPPKSEQKPAKPEKPAKRGLIKRTVSADETSSRWRDVTSYFSTLDAETRGLKTLSIKKITAGIYGDKNLDEGFLITTSFNPNLSSLKILYAGVKIWLKLEAKLMFASVVKDVKQPSTASPLPQSGHYNHV